jgi:hypothetical protein
MEFFCWAYGESNSRDRALAGEFSDIFMLPDAQCFPWDRGFTGLNTFVAEQKGETAEETSVGVGKNFRGIEGGTNAVEYIMQTGQSVGLYRVVSWKECVLPSW